MLSAYNAKLRQFVLDNRYMDTLAFHAIPSSTIIDLRLPGIPRQ